MDKKFLMGMSDLLNRKNVHKNQKVFLDKSLHKNLIKLAITNATEFYLDFFNLSNASPKVEDLTNQYVRDLESAKSYNLFKPGGIREKDHLNFWCLSQVFSPSMYIESGVYFGSSLHAFTRCSGIDKTILIDPDLTKLKVPKYDIPNGLYVDSQDFSELNLERVPEKTLAYFDDHINTAARIIQAHQKGIRYVVFDDSTGIEGITQRLYPAVPTIPMILNREVFQLGSTISWTWRKPENLKLNRKKLLKLLFKNPRPELKKVELIVNEDFIAQCKKANALIVRWAKIPDLGEFIPQALPERMVDTSKYILELKAK